MNDHGDGSGPVVLVGYSQAWLAGLAKYLPARSLVVVDEPDVLRKRDARAATANSTVLREFLEYPYQSDGAADAFFQRHRGLRPVAVLPSGDYGVPFAARIAERYGVPGAGHGAAVVLRDKRLQRVVTAAAGVANPESVPVGGPDEVKAFMAELPGSTVVLKPANRQAAVGVKVISDPAEVAASWSECLDQDEGMFVPDRPMPVRMLAERFLRGDEYSVELMVGAGRPVFGGVTRKFVFPGPRPVEQGHVHPAGADPALTERLLAGTRSVVDAVGMDSGFVHCEWIVDGGVPHLVECAGRLPGGWIPNLIELSWRYDIFGQYLALMTDGRLTEQPPPRAPGHAAIWMSGPSAAGEVEAVDGVDEARAAAGVDDVIVIDAGESTYGLRSSWDRTAGVIAEGSTSAQALDRARRALDRITIKIRPAVG